MKALPARSFFFHLSPFAICIASGSLFMRTGLRVVQGPKSYFPSAPVLLFKSSATIPAARRTAAPITAASTFDPVKASFDFATGFRAFWGAVFSMGLTFTAGIDCVGWR